MSRFVRCMNISDIPDCVVYSILAGLSPISRGFTECDDVTTSTVPNRETRFQIHRLRRFGVNEMMVLIKFREKTVVIYHCSGHVDGVFLFV